MYMNRSYCGTSQYSCVDKNDPSLHGCGSITFHVKEGLINEDLAINERYTLYDGVKRGGPHLPYDYKW